MSVLEQFKLADFESASARIRSHIRQTPLLKAKTLFQNPLPNGQLFLKLENLQPTGSFKIRGAMNTLSILNEEEKKRGLITASGGNHGLAVAYAAFMAQVPSLIFLPTTTPKQKIDKLHSWGAKTSITGEVWDESNEAALQAAKKNKMTYVHPFADARVIHGQGTIALEVIKSVPELDTLVVAVGGGGLIAGVAAAAKSMKPNIQVIGVEPVGAPTHFKSRAAGKVIKLDKIDTQAGTLAPKKTETLNFELIQKHVDDLILVDDISMQKAAEWLWFEFGIAAELSGAASIAALSDKVFDTRAGNVCSIICGSGTDGIT